MSSQPPSKQNFQNFGRAVTSPALRAIAEYWDQVRGHRLMPYWNDLSPSFLSPHFDRLWGFNYNPQTGAFIGMLAGKNVKDWLGTNFWGASLKDIHPPHIYSDAHQFLRKVVTMPAAGRCSGRLFVVGDKAITGERIALPMAANGIFPAGVLGASHYQGPIPPGPVELVVEGQEWFPI